MAKLLEGGYDYKFVTEPPDSLKCLICLSVVREPQQHGGCGKLFCKVCIDQHKLLSGKSCPHCRAPLADQGTLSLFHDLKSDQEVRSFLVQCTVSCGWTGELRLVEDHKKKDCPDTLIPCPRGCNNRSTKVVRRNKELHLQSKCPNRPYTCAQCEQEMEFRNARSHAATSCPKRQYTCPHCNEAGVYDERTTTHLTVCPKVEIECSKCLRKLLRLNEPSHPKDCPNEPVRCKYYNIGCGEKPLRKDLSKHEEDAQLHLSLSTDRIIRLTNMLVLKNTLTFRITSFETIKLSSKHCMIKSDVSTSQKGYRMCLEVYANGWSDAAGTHISVYACLMKGDHDDTLTWPFTGSVTVELLNQLEDKNHYKLTLTFPADHEASKRVVDGENGPGYGWKKFISHTALNYNASANTGYLKDDTLVFRVSAEAPDHKPWLECTATARVVNYN